MHAFHYTDFHETPKYRTSLYGNLVSRILLKLIKCENFEHKFLSLKLIFTKLVLIRLKNF
jgi:hypothetical protein